MEKSAVEKKLAMNVMKNLFYSLQFSLPVCISIHVYLGHNFRKPVLREIGLALATALQHFAAVVTPK